MKSPEIVGKSLRAFFAKNSQFTILDAKTNFLLSFSKKLKCP